MVSVESKYDSSTYLMLCNLQVICQNLIVENDLYYLAGKGVRLNGIPTFGAMTRLRTLDTNRFDLIDFNGDGLNDIITGNFHGPFQVGVPYLTVILYIILLKF